MVRLYLDSDYDMDIMFKRIREYIEHGDPNTYRIEFLDHIYSIKLPTSDKIGKEYKDFLIKTHNTMMSEINIKDINMAYIALGEIIKKSMQDAKEEYDIAMDIVESFKEQYQENFDETICSPDIILNILNIYEDRRYMAIRIISTEIIEFITSLLKGE